ncbi:MAG: class I SAM-dependent methyltransferase [Gemmatimonadota bacterium]|nr:class I SAM-dependent methyltransferase [Gemmatimonadota bacterium]
MVSFARWKSAQQYERGYWESVATRIAEGSSSQLEWYKWRAEQLVHKLRSLGLGKLTEGSARVLEVGSGPVGVIGFFPAVERVAVDPLEAYYSSNATLTAVRNPVVDYRQGPAEALPCESAKYDLVIMENCIDHVRDVTGAMGEIKRALSSAGTFYFTVNCRTKWGFMVHRALSRLRIDAGHPHTFTVQRARYLLANNGFKTLHFEVGSYDVARRADLDAPERRARLKGLLGISEFVVSAVAQPTPFSQT